MVVIRPRSWWVPVRLSELWEYRELLYFLTWRDVKVRYKQTVLGAAWAVLQPLSAMVVFTVFLGRLARVPSDGLPYPIFAYCGLVPWQFFSRALTEASMSLVEHRQVITKVYFPRLLVPVAAVLSGLVDFGIAFAVLIGMMFYYGFAPTVNVAALPLFLLLAVVTALGIAFWLSALAVEYRDVRYVLAFVTQIWLFATPVAYPTSLVPQRFRALYGLNPMSSVTEAFRWALLGKGQPPGPMMWVSVAVVMLVFAGGLLYFRRMESTFADVA
jgi:lipopolysaccharide transport system permease protein